MLKSNGMQVDRIGQAHIQLDAEQNLSMCVLARPRAYTTARIGYTWQRRRNKNSWIKGSFARHVPRGLTRGLKNPDGVAHLFCPPVRRSARLRSCCAPVGTDVRLTRLQVSPPSFIYDRLSLSLGSACSFFIVAKAPPRVSAQMRKEYRRTENATAKTFKRAEWLLIDG